MSNSRDNASSGENLVKTTGVENNLLLILVGRAGLLNASLITIAKSLLPLLFAAVSAALNILTGLSPSAALRSAAALL